jgi:hypothetical protein
MITLRFPQAIWLGKLSGPPPVALTDQGRSPVEVARDERFVENLLASGRKRRYYQAIKHTWTLNWDMLPEEDSETFDGQGARKTIKTILGSQGEAYLLKFYAAKSNNSSSGFTEHTVFCESLDESLIRRDSASGIYLWKLSLTLTEV